MKPFELWIYTKEGYENGEVSEIRKFETLEKIERFPKSQFFYWEMQERLVGQMINAKYQIKAYE